MSLRASLTVLSILALTACGGGGGSGSSGTGETTGGGETTETADAGTTETAAADPYAGPIGSTDIALGETKFNARCGGCHNNGAPVLTNIGWTVERMRRQIREGSGDMPAIGEDRLPAADMEAVLAYLQSVGAIAAAAAPASAP